MKTIKSIDGKSLLIGGLLACTIFFATGATSPTDKWDDKQEWLTADMTIMRGYGLITSERYDLPNGGKGTFYKTAAGWEPYGQGWRKRIK